MAQQYYNKRNAANEDKFNQAMKENLALNGLLNDNTQQKKICHFCATYLETVIWKRF